METKRQKTTTGKKVGKNQRGNRLSLLRKNVAQANSLKDPLEQFLSSCIYEKNGKSYIVECKRICNVNVEELEWILNLEERNMKSLYENCNWGWDFEKKKIEMTDEMAWYLIAKSSNGENVGFSHFRFDMDSGSAVLYCYEIQLEEHVQRIGLGTVMMNLLESMAFSNKMEKVVLTVFKHNSEAHKFFNKLNYSKDETSPPEKDPVFCYYILSKSHKVK